MIEMVLEIIYTPFIKGKRRGNKIDSRSENNEKIQELFSTKDSSLEEKENAKKESGITVLNFQAF